MRGLINEVQAWPLPGDAPTVTMIVATNRDTLERRHGLRHLSRPGG
jgi:hypothetical protein